MSTSQDADFDHILKASLECIIQMASHLLSLIETRSRSRAQTVQRHSPNSRPNSTSTSVQENSQQNQNRGNRQPTMTPNATSTPIRKPPSQITPGSRSGENRSQNSNVGGDTSYETIEREQYSINLNDTSSVTSGSDNTRSKVNNANGVSRTGSSSSPQNQSQSNSSTSTSTTTSNNMTPKVTNSKIGPEKNVSMTRVEGRPNSNSNPSSENQSQSVPCEDSIRDRRDAEIISIVRRVEKNLQISMENVRIIGNLVFNDQQHRRRPN